MSARERLNEFLLYAEAFDADDILAFLSGNGYAVVELPTHVADDNNNRAWEWVSRWYRLPDSSERVITTHSAPRTMTVDMAHSFASQLLAAAAAAERNSEER